MPVKRVVRRYLLRRFLFGLPPFLFHTFLVAVNNTDIVDKPMQLSVKEAKQRTRKYPTRGRRPQQQQQQLLQLRCSNGNSE